jgi:16S rRNA processing protein RimM
MTVDKCFAIGYLAKTHGLKGQLTLVPNSDCPLLAPGQALFLLLQQNLVPYFVKDISARHDKFFIAFEDVTSVEAAQQLKGAAVFVSKAHRPPLPRGEFYNDEVIGFEVHDLHLGLLGVVSEVVEHGPSRHVLIKTSEKEILIPVTGPFIKKLNKAKKVMAVELPEGLTDL